MRILLLLIFLPVSLFAATKIAIIGDSISTGIGASPDHGYVEVLKKRYSDEGKDIELINRSFGGAYTDSADVVTILLITTERPDYIVFFLGINDAACNVPQDVILNNLSSAIRKAFCNSKKVILGGVNSVHNQSYNAILTNVYDSLIKAYNCYPVMLLGPDVITHTTDGIHPNDVGSKMIADKLYDTFHEIGIY